MKIQKAPKSEFIQTMETEATMFHSLKNAIKLRNQEYWSGVDNFGQHRSKGIKFNSIIEPIGCNFDDKELFASKIDIFGMSDFDCFPKSRKGIQRYGLWHEKDKRNPLNIERISFIINDEIVEFVRCR